VFLKEEGEMRKPVVFLPRDGPRAVVLARVTFGRNLWPIVDADPYFGLPALVGLPVEEVLL